MAQSGNLRHILRQIKWSKNVWPTAKFPQRSFHRLINNDRYCAHAAGVNSIFLNHLKFPLGNERIF